MIAAERGAEYAQIRLAVTAWVQEQRDIVGAAIVGSWARGDARMSSDVDLVILTEDKRRYLDDESWIHVALGQAAQLVRTQEWGPLTERRVRLSSGLEVEFGFVEPSWAETHPLNPGTADVIRDGCEPLKDSSRVLECLIAAVCGP